MQDNEEISLVKREESNMKLRLRAEEYGKNGGLKSSILLRQLNLVLCWIYCSHIIFISQKSFCPRWWHITQVVTNVFLLWVHMHG